MKVGRRRGIATLACGSLVILHHSSADSVHQTQNFVLEFTLLGKVLNSWYCLCTKNTVDRELPEATKLVRTTRYPSIGVSYCFDPIPTTQPRVCTLSHAAPVPRNPLSDMFSRSLHATLAPPSHTRRLHVASLLH